MSKDNIREAGSTTIVIVLALTALLVTVAGFMFGHTMTTTDQVAISQSASRLEHVAASGIDKMFSRFRAKATQSEVNNMLDWINKGKLAKGSALPSFYINHTNVKSGADTWVKSNASKLLIYDVTNNGLKVAKSWSPSNSRQQVAMWVTSFKRPSAKGAFPYSTPVHVSSASAASPTLDLVAYAYASNGEVHSSARERVAWGNTVEGLSPIINANMFANNATMCSAAEPVVKKDSDTGETTISYNSASDNNSGVDDQSDEHSSSSKFLFIDATQSKDSVAVEANGAILMPSATESGAGHAILASSGEPTIVYDEGKSGGSYPASNVDGLASKTSLASGNERNTASERKYFTSPESELLPVNGYRTAANKIAGLNGEVIGGKTVVVSGTKGNYENLKNSNAGHARTGTISISDFVYNVRNKVPMYGIVRVMVPAVPQWTSAKIKSNVDKILASLNMNNQSYTVADSGQITTDAQVSNGGEDNGNGNHNSNTPTLNSCGTQTYKVSFDYGNLHNGHTIGDMNTPGAIIVYGSMMFDFFTDNNADGVFDPSSERLLTHKEATTAKLLVRSPVLVNPVLATSTPVISSDTDYLSIGSYPTGAPSNSLSSDAAISNTSMPIANAIVNVMKNYHDTIYGNGSYKYNDMVSLLGDKSGYVGQLDYMFRATARGHTAGYSDKSISDVDAHAKGFFIDTRTDVVTSSGSSKLEEASSADLFHAMLPNGYTHGWKRALDATGLAGSWNTLLTNADPDYTHRPLFIKDNKIDSKFEDIPAITADGGIVRFRGSMNVSGLLYTPGSFAFEQTHESKADDPTPSEDGDADKVSEDNDEETAFGSDKYISGAVLTGFGQYYENKPTSGSSDDEDDSRVIIISHDHIGFDNLPVLVKSKIIKRTHLQIM